MSEREIKGPEEIIRDGIKYRKATTDEIYSELARLVARTHRGRVAEQAPELLRRFAHGSQTADTLADIKPDGNGDARWVASILSNINQRTASNLTIMGTTVYDIYVAVSTEDSQSQEPAKRKWPRV